MAGSPLPGLIVFCVVAAIILAWDRVSPQARQRAALAASLLGIVFLAVGLSAKGLREEASQATFLLGTPYDVAPVTASAGLPAYLLTAVCLLLGTAGLALGEAFADFVSRRWVATAVVLSYAATLLRFALEKVAAPVSWSNSVGVTWLAPLVGAAFVFRLRAEPSLARPLVGALFRYALASRAGVAALMVGATLANLGSHYDLSRLTAVLDPLGRLHRFEASSLDQAASLAVLPQLTVWTLYSVVAGLIGAAAVSLLDGQRHSAPTAPATRLAPADSAGSANDPT